MLRYDTPDELRNLHIDTGMFGAWALGGVAALVAAAIGTGAARMGSTGLAVGCWLYVGLYLLGTVTFGVFVWRRRRYEVTVHLGHQQLIDAHELYDKLTAEHRGVAMPLLEALYRLAGTELAEEAAKRDVRARMSERVTALRTLVQAEDRVRLAAASHQLDDRDDLDDLAIWREAVAEVEAKLGPLDPPESARSVPHKR